MNQLCCWQEILLWVLSRETSLRNTIQHAMTCIGLGPIRTFVSVWPNEITNYENCDFSKFAECSSMLRNSELLSNQHVFMYFFRFLLNLIKLEWWSTVPLKFVSTELLTTLNNKLTMKTAVWQVNTELGMVQWRSYKRLTQYWLSSVRSRPCCSAELMKLYHYTIALLWQAVRTAARRHVLTYLRVSVTVTLTRSPVAAVLTTNNKQQCC